MLEQLSTILHLLVPGLMLLTVLELETLPQRFVLLVEQVLLHLQLTERLQLLLMLVY